MSLETTMAKYPKLGEWRKPPKQGKGSGRVCAVCGKSPAGMQFVEVDWMRGNDEMCAACDECRKNRKAEVIAKAE